MSLTAGEAGESTRCGASASSCVSRRRNTPRFCSATNSIPAVLPAPFAETNGAPGCAARHCRFCSSASTKDLARAALHVRLSLQSPVAEACAGFQRLRVLEGGGDRQLGHKIHLVGNLPSIW